ncbi:TetR/AcrR family transcriptional regulator [Streptacidiphilus rugosus]|uniref:TetR/AcrR family transcriptional regulator n=1 Tax=Streptacidiphilus rugosus TaxID=405783 RepID=UPI000AB50A26|nr:TetR/AcrR family transcriptional regulator [Streptacidiphilus rugosus]
MQQPASARRATIGRGAKVRTAVLAATIDELVERGYTTLTVDQIAQRAGVHKTTVYRRWADLDALIVDALTEHIAADIPIPDTGSVAEDLRLLARGLVAWISSPIGRAVLAIMVSDAAVRVPELAESRRRIFHDRIERARPVVDRAVARGELPPDTDAAELIKNLAAPVYFRVLITGESVDRHTADHAAAAALAAARDAGSASGS